MKDETYVPVKNTDSHTYVSIGAFNRIPTEILLREVTFNCKFTKNELQTILTVIQKRCGIYSNEYNLVNKRLEIFRKIDIRAKNKIGMNYSTDIKFYKKNRIDSGFSIYDFKFVNNSPKLNYKAPTSTLEKGYKRSTTEMKRSVAPNYRRSAFCTANSPLVTSYIYFTQKRVIVYLEDKVYKIRNAGRGFAFVQGTSSFYLVYLKTDIAKAITALDIIHNLPKIRKELRKKSLTKKQLPWKV